MCCELIPQPCYIIPLPWRLHGVSRADHYLSIEIHQDENHSSVDTLLERATRQVRLVMPKVNIDQLSQEEAAKFLHGQARLAQKGVQASRMGVVSKRRSMPSRGGKTPLHPGGKAPKRPRSEAVADDSEGGEEEEEDIDVLTMGGEKEEEEDAGDDLEALRAENDDEDEDDVSSAAMIEEEEEEEEEAFRDLPHPAALYERMSIATNRHEFAAAETVVIPWGRAEAEAEAAAAAAAKVTADAVTRRRSQGLSLESFKKIRVIASCTGNLADVFSWKD